MIVLTLQYINIMYQLSASLKFSIVREDSEILIMLIKNSGFSVIPISITDWKALWVITNY